MTLLPPLAQVDEVSDDVALAVARQAVTEGLAAAIDDEQIVELVAARKWTPTYHSLSDRPTRDV